jgi:hypothetical protein
MDDETIVPPLATSSLHRHVSHGGDKREALIERQRRLFVDGLYVRLISATQK